MLYFWLWLISWVVIGALIYRKNKSWTFIIGGSFLISLLLALMFSTFPDYRKAKNEARLIEKNAAIAAKAEKKAEAKKRREEKYEKCKKDLQCWGDKHSVSAILACQKLIERQSKYAFKWTDGVLGPKLTRFKWDNKNQLTLLYFGDKLQFQNVFGAWQNIIYQCGYDPINKKVTSVKVEPGRF